LFWDYEFTVINASRAIIDIFFYSYLQIKIQDPNLKISSADKTAFSRMGSVFNSYKKLIEIYKLDKTIIFEEIHEAVAPVIEKAEEVKEEVEEVVEEKPKTTLDSIVSLFASKEGKK